MKSTEPPEIKGESRNERQRESERKRQRILDAARSCFGRLGFARAKVETISAEAGVSAGLLYQFFRNKDHLFEVVIEEVMRDWVRAMVGSEGSRTRNAKRRNAGQRLEDMLRGSVGFARSHPLLPALLTEDAILELSRTSGSAPRRVEAHREHVANLLREGMASGEFRADLDVTSVADIICQLQVDYSSRAYRRRKGYPSGPELIDAAARFVHDALTS